MELPAAVTTADGLDHAYAVPHFSVWHDVLDEKATDWGPGGPIRWVLSAAKIEGLAALVVPKKAGVAIIREDVLQALKESGASSFEVRSARVIQ